MENEIKINEIVFNVPSSLLMMAMTDDGMRRQLLKGKTAMKFRELEEQAKKELQDELIANKKALLKNRLREIKDAQKVLAALRKQYQELLDKDVDEDSE